MASQERLAQYSFQRDRAVPLRDQCRGRPCCIESSEKLPPRARGGVGEVRYFEPAVGSDQTWCPNKIRRETEAQPEISAPIMPVMAAVAT